MNKIYSTKDYSQFKGVAGNRPVNMRHVNDLTASILRNNMLPQNPIIVNKNKEILDGQHRLKVAEANRLTIYYTVSEHGELEEVQQLNANVKPWTTQDYLASYISVGKQAYIEFQEFIQQYQLSIEGGFILLTGDNSARVYRNFKSGKFEFTQEQMEQARDKADLIWEVKNYFIDNGYKRVYFLRAINVIHEKGLGLRLVAKAKAAGMQLKIQYNVRDYLRMFEDLLNWNQKTNLVRLF